MKRIALNSFLVKTLMLAFVLLLDGCNQNTTFDSTAWKHKGIDWFMDDVRENMVDDLLKSNTLIGLNKQEVVELLGRPERDDTNQLTYLVREKYGWNLDPEYISHLVIELDDNQVVINGTVER